MGKNKEIAVKDVLIRTMTKDGVDYICITDIAFIFASWISVERLVKLNQIAIQQMLILGSDNNRHLLKEDTSLANIPS